MKFSEEELEEMLTKFKYQRDKNCQSCLILREQVMLKEVPYEEIDKTENKRMHRKGKQVARGKSSDNIRESEEDDEEEPLDVKKLGRSKVKELQWKKHL